jgi:hypothetical protein
VSSCHTCGCPDDDAHFHRAGGHVCLSDAQREAVRKAESILRVIHSGITTDLRAAFPECFDEPSTDPATAQRKAGF